MPNKTPAIQNKSPFLRPQYTTPSQVLRYLVQDKLTNFYNFFNYKHWVEKMKIFVKLDDVK